MMEPDVLNTRAWALDAVEDSVGLWRCETIFDGVGGDRPHMRDGALECPKERTRVQCVVDATTGDLAPSSPVLIWQERCWSASPAEDFEDSTLDADWTEWISSAVGLESFGDQRAGRKIGSLRSLGGGIEISSQPGLFEITLRSGTGSKLQYTSVVMRRSWAGDAAGRSVFAEVETLNDTEDQD